MSSPSRGGCFQLEELMSVPLEGSDPARLPPTHFVHKHRQTERSRPGSTVGSSHKRECLEDSLWLIYTTSCQSKAQHVLQTASPVFLPLLRGTEECVSRKGKVIYWEHLAFCHIKNTFTIAINSISFKVIWENLLKSKFWKAPSWMIPSHPVTAGNANLRWWVPVAAELHVKHHKSPGLGTGINPSPTVAVHGPSTTFWAALGFSRPELPEDEDDVPPHHTGVLRMKALS